MTETPLTVTSIADEVLDAVRGYNRHQDRVTSLSAPMSAADLTFTVADANSLSKGQVEIQDEIVQISSVDTSTGIISIEPWGRGQSGTTAATHAAGVRVTSSPLYPRQRIYNAIYGVLREIFPDVYGVNSTLLDGSAVKINYALPADCYLVLRVESQVLGGSGEWVPLTHWRVDKLPTTVELEILSPVTLGEDHIRVLYIRIPPVSLTAASDLTTYGYDYQIRDLVVLGAAAKLLAFTESARIQVSSMVAHGRAEAVPAGSASNSAKLLYQLFQKRVEDERRQLLLRHPPQPHYTR